jgi:hypothetical protein
MNSLVAPEISPNKVVVAAVGLFVLYWIAAMFTPAGVLLNLFNSLAFGTQVIVVVTWAPAAYRAIKNSADDGAWMLILAIFYINFVAMWQRIYAIAYNYAGRPDAWSDTAITGFWPYSYMIAGVLFLISPGVKSDGVRPKAWWTLVSAGVLGGFVAGVVFTLAISTS